MVRNATPADRADLDEQDQYERVFVSCQMTAVSLDVVGSFGLIAMGIFLAVLVVGFIYEWKKGALEWD